MKQVHEEIAAQEKEQADAHADSRSLPAAARPRSYEQRETQVSLRNLLSLDRTRSVELHVRWLRYDSGMTTHRITHWTR